MRHLFYNGTTLEVNSMYTFVTYIFIFSLRVGGVHHQVWGEGLVANTPFMVQRADQMTLGLSMAYTCQMLRVLDSAYVVTPREIPMAT